MSDAAFDPNFDIAGFAQRAKEAMFPERITTFATRVGLPQATVSKIINGGSVAGPRIDIAAKIADGLGVSLDWLVYGRGESGAFRGDVRIPRYAARLAAGAGSWNEGRVKMDTVGLPREVLQELRAFNLGHLTVLQAQGNSMEPTIANRGFVLVDEGVTDPFDDVFAFVLAGEARVKRFRRLNDALILISDNPAYPPETLQGEEMNRVQIIGQVLGVLQAI
jgi:transcriptional regulator with XRE-family HTH domain